MGAKSVLLSILLLTGCASANEPSKKYLPVIVDTGDGDVFPDPITPGQFGLPEDAPESLALAVHALRGIVPLEGPGDDVKTRNCELEPVDNLSKAYTVCAIAYCERLPPASRTQACGYIVRLQGWIEATWLGGDCDTGEFDTTTALARWFRGERVTDCGAMTEVLMVAHMRDALGLPWSAEALLGADGVRSSTVE